MAELRTEEEQVQAIKDWWKNNGSSLLIGIGAALAIVFGWQAWQNHQAQQRAEAANQFANLLNAFSSADDESADTVGFVAETLRDEHGDSAYAIYGNLVLARQQMVEGEDPAAAVESLNWALEKSVGEMGDAAGADLAPELAKVKSDLAALGAKVENLPASVASGGETPGTVEAIKGIDGRLTALEKNVRASTELSGTVSGVETSVGDLKTSLSDIETRLKNVEATAKAAQTAVTTSDVCF